MRGCSTNEVKKSEIDKMCLRREFDVCALRETKLKGKGEVMFGEVVGTGQGVWRGGRQGERKGGPVTEWAFDAVCSRIEGGVI